MRAVHLNGLPWAGQDLACYDTCLVSAKMDADDVQWRRKALENAITTRSRRNRR